MSDSGVSQPQGHLSSRVPLKGHHIRLSPPLWHNNNERDAGAALLLHRDVKLSRKRSLAFLSPS